MMDIIYYTIDVSHNMANHNKCSCMIYTLSFEIIDINGICVLSLATPVLCHAVCFENGYEFSRNVNKKVSSRLLSISH